MKKYIIELLATVMMIVMSKLLFQKSDWIPFAISEMTSLVEICSCTTSPVVSVAGLVGNIATAESSILLIEEIADLLIA